MVQKRYKLVSNFLICVYTACVEASNNCADVGEHCLCFRYQLHLVKKRERGRGGERYISINASSLQEDSSYILWFVCLFIVHRSGWFELWPKSRWDQASIWDAQFLTEFAVLVFVFECWANSGHCEKESRACTF